MANAKRCDVCGEFYEVPEYNPCRVDAIDFLDYIIVHRGGEREHSMYFDCCDKCRQSVIDYILTKRVDATCQE